MFDRLFLAHPRSVDETYLEHFKVAMHFGSSMMAAGVALFIHALVPALFQRTGSATIKRLYAEIKERQPVLASQPPAFLSRDWQVEYEI